MGGKVRDASWLIGPLLLIPALLYLSFWYSQTADFLRHARRATATVAPYQWGLPKKERNPHNEGYSTYFEFPDEQGQTSQGYLYDDDLNLHPGDTLEIYYDPRRPDFRLGTGPGGVYAGLYIALWWIGISLALGIGGLIVSRRPVVEMTPSYLDYWGGYNEYWNPKPKVDAETEQDLAAEDLSS